MDKSRRPWILSLVVLLVGLGTLVLTDRRGRATEVERTASGVVGGVQGVFAAVGTSIGDTFRSVGELRELRGEHEALLEDMNKYRQLENTVQVLERENDRLRAQLGFAAAAELPLLSAQVIASTPGSIHEAIRINRGERHGVEVGHGVIAFVDGRSGLVGRVRETTGGTSLVVPVSATDSFVAARLERTRYEGLLEGSSRFDDGLVLRYVSPRARNAIQYQDLVVTSGSNSSLPAEIPVGYVQRVDASTYDPHPIVIVEPIVDFTQLEYVFVLGATFSTIGTR